MTALLVGGLVVAIAGVMLAVTLDVLRLLDCVSSITYDHESRG